MSWDSENERAYLTDTDKSATLVSCLAAYTNSYPVRKGNVSLFYIVSVGIEGALTKIENALLDM